MKYKELVNNTITKKYIIITYLFFFIIYLIYLFSDAIFKEESYFNDFFIFTLSWLGIFILIYIILTWFYTTGVFFTPYLIYILFFFLFSFGQPIMWAFGIHFDNEIGNDNLFPGLNIPQGLDIIKAQILVILSSLGIHFGALIYHNYFISKNNYKKAKNGFILLKTDNITLKVIFYVSLLIGLITIPTTLYSAYIDMQYAHSYGYSSTPDVYKNSVQAMLLFMFFPSLVGLLIGSKYKKSVRITVYLIFFVYFLIHILYGDRGSWIYKLFILIWLHHHLYKPIKPKKFILLVLLSLFGLYIIDAIVKLRDLGISYESLINNISFNDFPLFSVIFEMGSSMKPIIVLQKYGWDIWPYPNSFLLAIVGIATDRIFGVLNIEFIALSDYFSLEYLGLTWGAGFSIVAESLLNFGPYLAPIIMILIGYLITMCIYIPKNFNYQVKPLRYYFVASTLQTFIPMIRNPIHFFMKEWFYGTIVITFIIFIISISLRNSRG